MGRRFAEIDALKAIAILTVVLIHSMRWPFDPAISTGEVWLGRLTRFAVPAFLMASGFLYAGGPAPSAWLTLRRLRRIAVPYFFASVIGQLWWAAQDIRTDTGSWPLDLLFGSSMGPYYYVFVIACLVLATPLFALVPARVMPFVMVALAIGQWWVDAASGMLLPFYWTLRNPLLWWAYFTLGWIVRQHYDALRDWIAPRRRGLIFGLAAATLMLAAASGLEGPRLLVRTTTWLGVYAICALVFTATCGKDRVPTALRYLSDTSYPIYLLHFFFVLAATDLVPPPAFRTAFLPIAFPWVAGLLGSISIIAALKAALGARSRDWIGA
jgi:surface polysaccharide O-acyltransferase-like enzyme